LKPERFSSLLTEDLVAKLRLTKEDDGIIDEEEEEK